MNLSSRFLHVASIAVLGCLIYSNTFGVPFLLDDLDYVANNQVVRDPGLLLRTTAPEAQFLSEKVKATLSTRAVAYLTFSANYRLGGLGYKGYHALNLAIHIVNALLVYALVLLVMRNAGPVLAGRTEFIALFVAALFVAHPVATQAVTYISQRFSSLAAMFSLLAILCYGSSRANSVNVYKRWVLYALSVIFLLGAMKTKENAVIFPIIICLYEMLFHGGKWTARFKWLVPHLALMMAIPLMLLTSSNILSDTIGPDAQVSMSRADYMLTQMRVIVTYLRLLIFPFNQNLDYDYPVYGSLLSAGVMGSALMIGLLLAVALYAIKRGREHGMAWRIVAFGILWFFIALSVESSFVVMLDSIFEHRLYMPSIGLFMAVAVVGARAMRRLDSRWAINMALALLVAMPLIMGGVAHKRNEVWGSGITLWQDVVGKSPNKWRGHNNLGFFIFGGDQKEAAVPHYLRALELKPDDPSIHSNLGNAYAEMGLRDVAINYYMTAISLDPKLAVSYNNLGIIYYDQGNYDRAIEFYQEAIIRNPVFARAYSNMGNAYAMKKMFGEAVRLLKRAKELKPEDTDIVYNLALTYSDMGDIPSALRELDLVFAQDSKYARAIALKADLLRRGR